MNMEHDATRLGITALIWTLWCLGHSLLNGEGPIRRTGLLDSPIAPYYRFFFNATAVATLILVSNLTPREGSTHLWEWTGWLRGVRVIVGLGALWAFKLTFRNEDVWEFLGFRAFTGTQSIQSGPARLITDGIYGVVRHPQFSAGLVLLWLRDMTDTDLVVNIVLSAYLIIGGAIEDRRLSRMFGDEWGRYRDRTPAFIPRPSAVIQAVRGSDAAERRV